MHCRHQVIHCPVCTDEVVNSLPLLEHGIESRGIERQVADGKEFFKEGRMALSTRRLSFGEWYGSCTRVARETGKATRIPFGGGGAMTARLPVR